MRVLTGVVWVLRDTLIEARLAEVTEDLEVVVRRAGIRLSVVELRSVSTSIQHCHDIQKRTLLNCDMISLELEPYWFRSLLSGELSPS